MTTKRLDYRKAFLCFGAMIIGSSLSQIGWAQWTKTIEEYQGAKELYIGYTISKNPDEAANARLKESQCLNARTLTSKQLGEDDSRAEAEIAFRRCLSSDPGIKFELAWCDLANCGSVRSVLQITPDQAVDPDVDLYLSQIRSANRYHSTGLYVELTSETCKLKKVSDHSEVSSPPWICERILMDARLFKVLQESAVRQKRRDDQRNAEMRRWADAASKDDTSPLQPYGFFGASYDAWVDGKTLLMWAASGCAFNAARLLLHYDAFERKEWVKSRRRAGLPVGPVESLADVKDKSGKTASDYVSCKSKADAAKFRALLKSHAPSH